MINALVVVLLLGGLLFFTGAAVGILRFPDFYSRLHPAGKLDTAGHFLMMSAMALYTAQPLTVHGLLSAAKILMIMIFVYLTSPTATHAIVDAGIRGGLGPWTKS